MVRKSIALLSIFLLLVIFFGIQYSFLSKRTQSFSFADENEHLVPAFMMTNFGSRLYTDLSTNHQPIPIILSFVFFKIVPYQNPFMLIERVRQYMFFLSFVGALVLVLRFGVKGLMPVLFIETTKFYLFGYHMLSESLIIYPIAYVTFIIGELLLGSPPPRVFTQCVDWIISGVSFFLITFSLLPAWPFVGVAYLVMLWKAERKRLFLFSSIFCFFVLTVFLFSFISPFAWVLEPIINNIRYYLPYESGLSFVSIFPLLFLPFTGILSLREPISIYYLSLFMLTAISLIFIFKAGKYMKKPFVALGIYYILFILLNIRVTSLNVSFYRAFHLAPQLTFLTVFTAVVLFWTYGKIANQRTKKIFLIWVASFSLFVFLRITVWWRESLMFDKINEHFINYGEEESVGMAVWALKMPYDRLLSGEQSGFINIYSQLPLATRQTAYLSWAYRSETLRTQFLKTMRETPPTFIFFPISSNSFFQALENILKEKYTRIKRSDGALTNLYILTKAINQRSDVQWKRFEELYYKDPR